MNGFVLHPGAYSDLDEIWEYIAADNQPAADRFLDRIYAALERLASSPRIGHKRPDLTSRPLRFHVVREYLIAYAPEEKPLVVVGVLHGSRSPRIMANILRGRE
jgi:plasmid stabilization system protein ParE